MTKFKIPLTKPCIGTEELDHMKDVMSSGCIAGTCEEVTKFEENFARFVGSNYAIATSSCTTALHIACKILQLNEKSNVFVPSYTFPATAYAPMYTRSKVNIIDVDKSSFNIDLRSVSIQPGTTIIPVHCLGNPCDMKAMMSYANEQEINVIEDSACGIAATVCGKHTGTFGNIGCYSFYAIKELCTGEGGMLVTDNEAYAETARALVDFGKSPGPQYPNFNTVGYNYRLSGLQAAMGNIQLSKLRYMHRKRTQIAEIYNKQIYETFLPEVITPQKVLDSAVPSYQRYATLLRKDIDRNKVIKKMDENGIQVSLGTYDLSSMPLFNIQKNKNPIGRYLLNHVLSLPMYPELKISDAKRVVETLAEIIEKEYS